MDDGFEEPSGGGRHLLPLVKALLLGLAISASDGCGTIVTFSDGLKSTDSAVSPKPFGGTRLDVRAVSVFCEQEFPLDLLSILFVLDVPLSAAADLVTLPITIPLHLTRPDEAPPSAPDDLDRPPVPERPVETGPCDGDPPPSEADGLLGGRSLVLAA